LDVLRNSPNQATTESYVKFLRTCEILRQLQIAGALTLQQQVVEILLGDKTFPAPDANALLEAAKAGGGEAGNYIWTKLNDHEWGIAQNVTFPIFTLNEAKAKSVVTALKSDGVFKSGDALREVLLILNQGVVVKSGPANRHGGEGETRLILRSYSSILSAVATEQEPFDALLSHGNEREISMIPLNQLRPVLRTIWRSGKPIWVGAETEPVHPDSVKLRRDVVALDFAGKRYAITDPVRPAGDRYASWNRKTFQLVVDLHSLISVDISKYPLPTTLQIR